MTIAIWASLFGTHGVFFMNSSTDFVARQYADCAILMYHFLPSSVQCWSFVETVIQSSNVFQFLAEASV